MNFTQIKDLESIMACNSISPKEVSKLPELPGLYFILFEKNILYIGCTHNLYNRLTHHELSKLFKRAINIQLYYITSFAQHAALLEREKRLIKHLSPALNTRGHLEFLLYDTTTERFFNRTKILLSIGLSKGQLSKTLNGSGISVRKMLRGLFQYEQTIKAKQAVA